ncbi:MAG: hypothetical protein RIQ53_460 [Pseudomonadota bacterium]|jgi:Xaa-Pro aminopeptidase
MTHPALPATAVPSPDDREAAPAQAHPVPARLQRVRAALARCGAQALLVPSADPHLSEYLPLRWQGRAWLSGFTGSMGTLVVTTDRAVLFADSRYWEQAETQLAGSGIALEKIPTGAATHHITWLARELPAGSTVAVDGQVLGLAGGQALRRALQARDITLRTDLDLFDATVWPDRPDLPAAPVYEHTATWTDRSRADRLATVRAAMAAHGASHHLVSTLDDVAWITNLRGADVTFNPVFLAHLLLSAREATLFVGAGKIDAALAAALAADGLRLADYAQAGDALAALPAASTLLVDPRRITWGLRERVAEGVAVVEAINPSTLEKSRKTAHEQACLREAMAHDGAAMCRFYARFEADLAAGVRHSELSVDEHLSAERAKLPGYRDLSFDTIAGYQANGALPHYRAEPHAFRWLDGAGLLLIDSGGQYLGGTTDITRVWPIGGAPTAAQRRDYTRVLQGMMNLSRAVFPEGTPGPMLDALARAPLWADGLDYGHGTGHGVGYFLNVHEGPQSISKTVPEPQMALRAGMVTSNEPGLYRPGQWGIRIENLLLTVPQPTPEDERFGAMLAFETLTLCPIDTRLVEPTLLRPDETAWLDAYHATVRERLTPLLQAPGDAAALAWLDARTQPLDRP